MKHTPGPWSVGDRPAGEWWHIYAGNQSICTAHATSKKHAPVCAEMFRANAILIAAAPELLKALINLERTAGLPAMHDDPVRVAARAAIAKATGEQE